MSTSRRALSTPVVVIGCALVFAVLVAIAFVAFGVGGDDGSDDPAAEETAAAPSEERLTSESRLGYAGLGPLALGSSFEDVKQDGRIEIEQLTCGYMVVPVGDSGLGPHDVGLWFDEGLAVITIHTPAVSTISGVHVGSTDDEVFRTYANAVETSDPHSPHITITSADGRYITFYLGADRTVQQMMLARNPDVVENWARC